MKLSQDVIYENMESNPEAFFLSGKANDLLPKLFSLYDPKDIIDMLRSDDIWIVKTGIWLASELGRRALPLLEHVVPLLSHGDMYVRYFAIDVVALALADGSALLAGNMQQMLNDPDQRVRNKTARLLGSVAALSRSPKKAT